MADADPDETDVMTALRCCGRSLAAPCARGSRSRSSWASSTATRRFRRSSSRTRRAWSSRVDEINAAGGVLGRPLELVVARRQRQSRRRGARRRGAALARKGRPADGDVLVGRRPRRRRPREAAQGAVPRLRAADRQDRLGERQQVHVPAARRRRTCRPRCWCRKRPSSARSAGRSSIRTTNTASRRPRRSSSR